MSPWRKRVQWISAAEEPERCGGCAISISVRNPYARIDLDGGERVVVLCENCCDSIARRAGYIHPDHLIRLSQDLRDESLHLKVSPRRLLDLIEIDDGDHDGTPD